MSTSLTKRRHVVIMQPYFLPYRNYFGLIRRCDEFVIFDDVQFSHRWQQRNYILNGRGGKEWLTIPVVSRRPERQRIREVMVVSDGAWRTRMLARVRHAYERHPCFDVVYPEFERIVLTPCVRLVDLTVALLQWAVEVMALKPPVWRWASALPNPGLDRNQRLIEICGRLGATHYVSGPAAKVYLRPALFAAAGLAVIWHEETYDEYPQASTPRFDHFVSILDLIMNHGARSRQYVNPLPVDPSVTALPPAGCATAGSSTAEDTVPGVENAALLSID